MNLESSHKLINRKNKFIFFIILFILSISTIIFHLIINTVSNHNVINSTVIAERLSKISELSTVKYNYSNILSIKNSKKFKDYSIPFTEKSFLIKYSGYIKAGVDLKDLDVRVSNEKITITLKKAKLLDHVIDDKNLSVYDEKSSIFNRLSIQDVTNEISSEKKRIEINLVKTDFLDKANANTKLLLQGILLNMGFKNVTIVFK